VLTRKWATAVTGASLPTWNRSVFVGSSDGNLYRLTPSTGAIEKTFAISANCQSGAVAQVSRPMVDATAGLAYVGTLNGCLAAVPAFQP
jgi:hypothetical protein